MKIRNVEIIIVIVVIVISAVCYISTRGYLFGKNKIEKIVIEKNIFYSEVVSSADKMQKGLGGRENICQSCAMLFKFSAPGKQTFWMKDMRFPLDIIWIADGKIVYLKKNVSEKFSGVLVSPMNADQVLEINAGISDKLGIKVGDSMR